MEQKMNPNYCLGGFIEPTVQGRITYLGVLLALLLPASLWAAPSRLEYPNIDIESWDFEWKINSPRFTKRSPLRALQLRSCLTPEQIEALTVTDRNGREMKASIAKHPNPRADASSIISLNRRQLQKKRFPLKMVMNLSTPFRAAVTNPESGGNRIWWSKKGRRRKGSRWRDYIVAGPDCSSQGGVQGGQPTPLPTYTPTPTATVVPAPPASVPAQKTGSRCYNFTNFHPKTHGFKFENSFHKTTFDFLGIKGTLKGLCGGMVYSALDHYFNGITVTNRYIRPRLDEPFTNYITDRQHTSVMSNLDKWGELATTNWFGARSSQFFNWGLQGYDGGRLQELRESIDSGRPVPLGLFKAGEGGFAAHHQVLAIGYDCGKYAGDLGDHKEDLDIFVYDPNYPGEIKTLKADVGNQRYYYKGQTGRPWLTYFVDRKYQPVVPVEAGNMPVFPNDGKFREVIVTLDTGNDDLRGGNDNVDLTLIFKDEKEVKVENVNRSERWADESRNYESVLVEEGFLPSELKSIRLDTHFGGGLSGDNWNLNSLGVRIRGGSGTRWLGCTSCNEEIRFTGGYKSHTFHMYPADGQAYELMLKFHTGGDDLRGGGDNVNATVEFSDGRQVRVDNLNRGRSWPNNSIKHVGVFVPGGFDPSDVTKVHLETTFGGGLGGDNWNLDLLELEARGHNLNEPLICGGCGFFRFTGERTTRVIPIHPDDPFAREIVIEFLTGGDDLRGGNDNVNVEVGLKDGYVKRVDNLNGGQNWGNHSRHHRSVFIDDGFDPEDLDYIRLETTSGGGIGGDNWNLDSIRVWVRGAQVNEELGCVSCNHGHRFTGRDRVRRYDF